MSDCSTYHTTGWWRSVHQHRYLDYDTDMVERCVLLWLLCLYEHAQPQWYTCSDATHLCTHPDALCVSIRAMVCHLYHSVVMLCQTVTLMTAHQHRSHSLCILTYWTMTLTWWNTTSADTRFHQHHVYHSALVVHGVDPYRMLKYVPSGTH